MERWLGAAPSADAPGAGRSGTRRRALRAERKKKVARRTHELKGVRASTLKGCCARLFQGPQDI
jgi:hypothetical protein